MQVGIVIWEQINNYYYLQEEAVKRYLARIHPSYSDGKVHVQRGFDETVRELWVTDSGWFRGWFSFNLDKLKQIKHPLLATWL